MSSYLPGKSGHQIGYTPNRKEVYVPDVKITDDKPSYYALPMRGWGFTLAVYDTTSEKFVGWVESKDLGFKSSHAFAQSDKYRKDKLAKFLE